MSSSRSFLERLRDWSYRYRALPGFYGRDFKAAYAFLTHTADWSRNRIETYKLDSLRSLVAHAIDHVPFYRQRYGREGIAAEDIRSLADFSRLPELQTDDLVESAEQLHAEQFDTYHPLPTHTSGTTGQSKSLFRGSRQEAFRRAALWCVLNKHGYLFKQKRITLEPPRSFSPCPELFDLDRVENNLVVEGRELLAGRHREIIDLIRSFRPRMLWSLPNPLVSLADFMLTHELPPIPIDLVVTYGEKIYPHTLALIRQAFPSTYLDYYGNRENTIAAWGPACGRFIEFSEYCHLENAAGKDAPGDLISTSLHNYAMPLIRYNCGDLVSDLRYDTPDSTRPSFELLGGRGKDLLLSRAGLTPSYVLLYLESKQFTRLRTVQLEQTTLDEVTLRVVVGPDYDRTSDEPLVLEYARKALMDQFQVSIEYVDRIPLTDGGKFRPVLSKLATAFLQHKTQSTSEI